MLPPGYLMNTYFSLKSHPADIVASQSCDCTDQATLEKEQWRKCRNRKGLWVPLSDIKLGHHQTLTYTQLTVWEPKQNNTGFNSFFLSLLLWSSFYPSLSQIPFTACFSAYFSMDCCHIQWATTIWILKYPVVYDKARIPCVFDYKAGPIWYSKSINSAQSNRNTHSLQILCNLQPYPKISIHLCKI